MMPLDRFLPWPLRTYRHFRRLGCSRREAFNWMLGVVIARSQSDPS